MYILKNNKGTGFLVDSLNYKGVWEAGSSADIDADGDLDILICEENYGANSI